MLHGRSASEMRANQGRIARVQRTTNRIRAHAARPECGVCRRPQGATRRRRGGNGPRNSNPWAGGNDFHRGSVAAGRRTRLQKIGSDDQICAAFSCRDLASQRPHSGVGRGCAWSDRAFRPHNSAIGFASLFTTSPSPMRPGCSLPGRDLPGCAQADGSRELRA